MNNKRQLSKKVNRNLILLMILPLIICFLTLILFNFVNVELHYQNYQNDISYGERYRGCIGFNYSSYYNEVNENHEVYKEEHYLLTSFFENNEFLFIISLLLILFLIALAIIRLARSFNNLISLYSKLYNKTSAHTASLDSYALGHSDKLVISRNNKTANIVYDILRNVGIL